MVSAQDTAAFANYFPKTTIGYLEVSQPAGLIEKLTRHPLVSELESNEGVKAILATPEFAAGMIGKVAFENAIGQTLDEAVAVHGAEGIGVCLDSATGGLALLAKSNDEANLRKVLGATLRFATNAGAGEIEKSKYRDASVAKLEGAVIARYKSWFLVSNKKKLAKVIVDNLHDKPGDSLANENWFKTQGPRDKTADMWGTVNLDLIRRTESDAPMFSGRTDNPGIELLFGGILDALKNTPHVRADLTISDELDLRIGVPFEETWADDARGFFFGPEMDGRAPKPIVSTKTISNITSYRDLGAWWLSKENLFEENVIAELAQADSQISTIFSGMDFGEEVLGALQPGVQIVVAENQFEKDQKPDVRLPAFALVGKLKDGKKMQRKLKIAFQSVIGFANIQLGMDGQPQLDLETESMGEMKLLTASYVAEEGQDAGLLIYNFAPTVAFLDSNIVISSNRELAVELIDASKAEASSMDHSNTFLAIDGPMLYQILNDNKESLIANNMISEGNNRAAAEKEISLALSLASLIKSTELSFEVADKEMKLDWNLQFSQSK